MVNRLLVVVLLVVMGWGLAPLGATDENAERALIRRAQVLMPPGDSSLDLLQGPQAPDAFTHRQTITCEYVDKEMTGASPKFACLLPNGDELKVKYGGTNGEVYGEVAASRLLWALGFPADRMYAVRVICRGCPPHVGNIVRPNGDRVVDPAAVERKIGTELLSQWHWDDLDSVDERDGGATVAERDALKLLAVLLQHSDSKPDNQRVVCLDAGQTASGAGTSSEAAAEECERPFLMIQDLGVTFGRANPGKQQPRASVNLQEWAPLPIWKDPAQCIGNLDGSWRGSLKDPVIREAGRQLLAERLVRLSDAQLRDIFTAARVTLRPRHPASGRSGFPTVDEWVSAFKAKRQQIVDHRCPA